ncbi:hypothetical protein Droror1_Dr00000125 [Drosera rotundifolia]
MELFAKQKSMELFGTVELREERERVERQRGRESGEETRRLRLGERGERRMTEEGERGESEGGKIGEIGTSAVGVDASLEDVVHVGDDRRNDIWGARDAGCDAWLWGSDVQSFKELVEWQVNPPVGFKHKVTDNLQRVAAVLGADPWLEPSPKVADSTVLVCPVWVVATAASLSVLLGAFAVDLNRRYGEQEL